MEDIIARAIKDIEQKITPTTPFKEKEASDPDLLYEKSFKKIKEGNIVSGVVVETGKDGVLVSVGFKSEGTIPLHELSLESFDSVEDVVNVGEEIKVTVLSIDDGEGNMILSKKRADLKEILDKIAEAFKTNRPIEGEVLCQVKGGLIANVGIQGFIPVSHIRKEAVRNLDSYIGKRIKAKVLEFNRKKREVVLSIKAAEEEERKRKREEFLNNVVEGQIRKGRITKLTKFGAFVNLGEMDGLIPLSELSWRRIKHPRDVVKVGDKVNAVVIKVDRANGKISLSLKEAQTSPWEKIEERISVGSIVDGKITKVTPYYTFVEVDGEVEGLLPNREILPSVILKEGQRVKVKVIGLESKQKRLILSLKKAEEEREREEIEAYLGQPGKGGIKLGEVLQGKV